MGKTKESMEIVDVVEVRARSAEEAWEKAREKFLKDHPEIDPKKVRLANPEEGPVN